ncbi:iron ABC transporter permease [Pigmentiphaga soli]|uniref:Iron ABC transporter permease n=1 Tax=Pigmentiphaga soli TaxID=1007095 RepID=A0ABP8GQE9_9BURK
MVRVDKDEAARSVIVAMLVATIMMPVGLIVYQSLLDQPFFSPRAAFGWSAYLYIFQDPIFWQALGTTILLSVGMVVIAVPLGAGLAFLLTRTDLKGRRWFESLVLVPIFISSIVLAFGYTVSVGPSGFVSLALRPLFGDVPWNLYSLPGLIIAAGLSHVPHVYLYVSTAMKNIASDQEEAARTAGAGTWRVMTTVTLPLVMPAIVFSAALNVLLGFELFGLPLILGDPSGIVVLTTYIYKLTTLLGVPSYQLMAAVTVVLIVLTLPLVLMQRRFLRRGRSFATVGGKGGRVNLIRLGTRGQVVALTLLCLWLIVAVILPIGGIALRAFVSAWGMGINPFNYLTLANFGNLLDVPSLTRGIVNTILLSTIGGGIAVIVYTVVALAGHRWKGLGAAALDYSVLLPRALPGLIIGLAFFWVFLFVTPLRPIRTTLIALLIAYTIVGLSYGLRLIQATLLQIGPELEEVARTTGARMMRVRRDILIPLIRPGLVGAWVLIIIIFLREYSTGVYLMGAGTEVIGSLIVGLLATGAVDTVAALSLISIVLTAIGLFVAMRLGVRVHD